MTEESEKPASEEPSKPAGEESPRPDGELARKPASRRPVWIRGFYMLLLALFWYVAELVLFAVAIVQFIFALAGGPNERLTRFGKNLSRYLRDVGLFITYATDDLPFPFTDWPAEV